jgi:hypothetical protein
VIGTRVVRATVMGSGGISFVDVTADSANNHACFEKCLAVDFLLVCQLAEAYARASVWFHAKPAVKLNPIVTRVVTIVDKKTKSVRYSQQVVGPVNKLPNDKELGRRALERVAELEGRGMSKFQVRVEEKEGPPVSA